MGKNDADRTCGLRADTRGIDEIDLMEEASTGRLKAPTDGANACVNAAKFDQLGSRIRIGPVDFRPPPPSRLAAHFLHRGAVRTGTIFNLNGHSHHARTPVLPKRGAGRAGVNGKGKIRCWLGGRDSPEQARLRQAKLCHETVGIRSVTTVGDYLPWRCWRWPGWPWRSRSNACLLDRCADGFQRPRGSLEDLANDHFF